MIPVVVGSNPIGHPITMFPPQKFASPSLGLKARAGDAFIANVKAAVDQILSNRAGAAAGLDPEYLHQLRVGMRRLRSTMRACRRLLRRKDAAHHDRRLRDAMRAFGEARDWDVFVHAFRRTALGRLAGMQGEAARRMARASARSTRLRFLSEEILAWARGRPWRGGAQPGQPMSAFARSTLERIHARLMDTANRVDWGDAPRRHRVRILVKRLRYGCECFAAAWPEEAMQPFLKRLRTLQDILGELNDIDVQRPLMRRLAENGASAPAVAAAMRSLARRERMWRARLSEAWEEFVPVSPYWRVPEAATAPG